MLKKSLLIIVFVMLLQGGLLQAQSMAKMVKSCDLLVEGELVSLSSPANGIAVYTLAVSKVIKGDVEISEVNLLVDNRVGCAMSFSVDESAAYFCRKLDLDENNGFGISAGTYYVCNFKVRADVAVLSQEKLLYLNDLAALLQDTDETSRLNRLVDLVMQAIETGQADLVGLAIDDLTNFPGAIASLNSTDFQVVLSRFADEISLPVRRKLGEIFFITANPKAINALVDKLGDPNLTPDIEEAARILTWIGQRRPNENIAAALEAAYDNERSQGRVPTVILQTLAKTHVTGTVEVLEKALIDTDCCEKAVDALVIKAQNKIHRKQMNKALDVLRQHTEMPQVEAAMAEAELK